jgi:LysE type translocator
MSLEFLITSLIVVVSPGTGVLYTLATGLSRASVVAAFGCTLGIVPHMAAAILGVAALLHTSAVVFQTFKYLGVAYLLYMAWHALRERGALRVEPETTARSAAQVTVTAILINILNPTLDLLSRLPAAVRQRHRDASARPHARVERDVHGHDVRGVRRLWPMRGVHPHPHHLAPAHPDLDAANLCSGVRCPRCQACSRRSLNVRFRRPLRDLSCSIFVNVQPSSTFGAQQ